MFTHGRKIAFIGLFVIVAIALCAAFYLLSINPAEPVAKGNDSEGAYSGNVSEEDLPEAEVGSRTPKEPARDPALEDNIAMPEDSGGWTKEQLARLEEFNQEIVGISRMVQHLGRELQAAKDSLIHSDPENSRLLASLKEQKISLRESLEKLPRVLELEGKIAAVEEKLRTLAGNDDAPQTDSSEGSASRGEQRERMHALQKEILEYRMLIEKSKRDAMKQDGGVADMMARISACREKLSERVLSDGDVKRITETYDSIIAQRDQVLKERAEFVDKALQNAKGNTVAKAGSDQAEDD